VARRRRSESQKQAEQPDKDQAEHYTLAFASVSLADSLIRSNVGQYVYTTAPAPAARPRKIFVAYPYVLPRGDYRRAFNELAKAFSVTFEFADERITSKQILDKIRQHFLVQLNGQFEGDASGETFNYDGKTDIPKRPHRRVQVLGRAEDDR
jgi:hypothetical protein